ncbi:MAG: type II toxin-antitoxin system prevent-host-death family antitoxin [Gammaproteobacteria bacterium]
METMTYSDFRKNLAVSLDRINEDHVPILVTRQSGKSAVIMSQEDFKSYEETAYLMSSVNNANRLNRAIKQLENKKGKIKRLIEE